MVAVAVLYRTVLDGQMESEEAIRRLAGIYPGADFSNGFFHDRPGHERVA